MGQNICNHCLQDPQDHQINNQITLTCPDCDLQLDDDEIDDHFDIKHHCILQDGEQTICMLCGLRGSLIEHFKHVKSHNYRGDGMPLRYRFNSTRIFDPSQLIILQQKSNEIVTYLDGVKYRAVKWQGTSLQRVYKQLYERGGIGYGIDDQLQYTTVLLHVMQ